MNLGPPLYVRYEPQLQPPPPAPPPHPPDNHQQQALIQLLYHATSIQPATIHTYRFLQSTCESILSNYYTRLPPDQQQQPRQPSPAPSIEHARGSPSSSLSSYQEHPHIADDDDDDKQDSHSSPIPLVPVSPPPASDNDNKQDDHAPPIPLVPYTPTPPPAEEDQQQQQQPTPPITSDIHQWPTNRSQLHNDDMFQRMVERVTTVYNLTSHQKSCLLHQYVNNVPIQSLISLFYHLVTHDIIDLAANNKPRSFTWLQLLHAIIQHRGDADIANTINARQWRWFTVYKATKCISLHQLEPEEIPPSMKEASHFLMQQPSSHHRRRQRSIQRRQRQHPIPDPDPVPRQ